MLAEAYGGDLSRWPEEVRHDAAVFAKANPELLQGEGKLDEALDSFVGRNVSPQLLEKILSEVGKETSQSPVLLIFRFGNWMQGMTLVSLAVLGLFLGSINMVDSQDFADSSLDEVQDIFNSTSSTITNEVMP